jgi:hypothetical protein
MPLSLIPEEPAVPAEQHAAGRVFLRYEDLSQDGHLVVEALPHALGEVWRRVVQQHGPPRSAHPILSRAVAESGEGPIGVSARIEARGFYQLAHTVGADGEVDRIILAMWARASGPLGRTHGPPPADAGRTLEVGRVFAEHVFTRPFGPPEERKVRAIEIGGERIVPPARYPWRRPEAALELPEGAVALDPERVLDTSSTVFGLDHTDSNQHVNSLVYPRLFIEAALRRLAAHGLAAPPLRARSSEIAYRRPCFAGERVRASVQAFTLGDQPGATCALFTDTPAGTPPPGEKPRCFARILFAR